MQTEYRFDRAWEAGETAYECCGCHQQIENDGGEDFCPDCGTCLKCCKCEDESEADDGETD